MSGSVRQCQACGRSTHSDGDDRCVWCGAFEFEDTTQALARVNLLITIGEFALDNQYLSERGRRSMSYALDLFREQRERLRSAAMDAEHRQAEEAWRAGRGTP